MTYRNKYLESGNVNLFHEFVIELGKFMGKDLASQEIQLSDLMNKYFEVAYQQGNEDGLEETIDNSINEAFDDGYYDGYNQALEDVSDEILNLRK